MLEHHLKKKLNLQENTNDTLQERIYPLKELVIMETSIENVHEEFYIIDIKNMAFNLPCVLIIRTYYCVT